MPYVLIGINNGELCAAGVYESKEAAHEALSAGHLPDGRYSISKHPMNNYALVGKAAVNPSGVDYCKTGPKVKWNGAALVESEPEEMAKKIVGYLLSDLSPQRQGEVAKAIVEAITEYAMDYAGEVAADAIGDHEGRNW